MIQKSVSAAKRPLIFAPATVPAPARRLPLSLASLPASRASCSKLSSALGTAHRPMEHLCMAACSFCGGRSGSSSILGPPVESGRCWATFRLSGCVDSSWSLEAPLDRSSRTTASPSFSGLVTDTVNAKQPFVRPLARLLQSGGHIRLLASKSRVRLFILSQRRS